ncbi:MAG: hypothetical protein AABY22_24255, partial [Nanoarchaeota archaeon]
ARGMMIVVEKGINEPVNLGSGQGCTIKELVEVIIKNLDKKPQLVWDSTKPMGDKKRLMDMQRANSIGFSPEITLEKGIKETMKWYKENKDIVNKRFNVFYEKGLA